MELIGYVVLLILLISVIRDKWKQSKNPAAVIQPSKLQVEITISDKGKGNLPTVTVKASGCNLSIESIKQDASDYIVTAENKDANEVLIAFEKKVPCTQDKPLA